MRLTMRRVLAAAAAYLVAGAAHAQSGSWQFPVLDARSNTVGTILVPGVAWGAGTPLDGYSAEEPVTIVQKFYAALATGNVAAASQFLCAGDRALFTDTSAADAKAYLERYPSRQKVGLIQYPTLAVVFVRLVSPSGSILRAIELLPPAADPITHVYPPRPMRTASCITKLDEAAIALRDILERTMPDLRDATFPNPYPNGIPNR